MRVDGTGTGSVPEAIVPYVNRGRPSGLPTEALWSSVPELALRRSEDGMAPLQATTVQAAYDRNALFVRFDCEDCDIWGTHRSKDAPLWEEEVVEIFIAPGSDDPTDYVEIEVNPLGTVFDALVANPEGQRASMRVDPSWSSDGLAVAVSSPRDGLWRAVLAIPWGDLCRGSIPPRIFRANFFRIERPHGGSPEFSAWSPTLVQPADFHIPQRFGRLVLSGADAAPW